MEVKHEVSKPREPPPDVDDCQRKEMITAGTVGMPTPRRRILLLGASVLGTQCIIALSMSFIGMAIAAVRMLAGDDPVNWRAILVAGGKTYAEAVSVLSVFFVALFVTVTEYALRRGKETREPVAFWRGISTVATVSLFIASSNVIVYAGLAFGDGSGAFWRSSALALTYLGFSVLALLAAVRVRYIASEMHLAERPV